MKTIKRWLRRWLGINSNLETMLNLIIVDGNNRIKSLEDNRNKIHLLEGKIDSIKTESADNVNESIHYYKTIVLSRISKLEEKLKHIDEDDDTVNNRVDRAENKIHKLEDEDNTRRLDRLEECISIIYNQLHNINMEREIAPRLMEQLSCIVIDMYDEQAASRGEFDEDK